MITTIPAGPDPFVLTVDAPVAASIAARIHAAWDAAFGLAGRKPAPLIILDAGMRLACIAPTEAERPPPAGWDSLENVR